MECPICLGPLNRCPEGIEDNVRRRLTKIRTATCCCTPCGHIFHKACLLTWLDQSSRPPCPVCNVKLSKMKLYPAYLNIDKDRGVGAMYAINNVKKDVHRPSAMSALTSGASQCVTSTATATVTMPAAPNIYPKSVHQHRRGSNTAAAIAGTSTPGRSGLTTMTIGAYALTTFGIGPLPVVTTTTLGALSGAGDTLPRTQSQQSGNLEMTNPSAFVAFPRSSISVQIPSTSSSSASGADVRGGTVASWSRGMNATNIGANATAAQHQPSSWTNNETIRGGTVFSTTTTHQLGNIWPWDFTATSICQNSNRGSGGHARSRYSPYRRPPPAHATSSSSLPRRITNIFNNAGNFTNMHNNPTSVRNNVASIADASVTEERAVEADGVVPHRLHNTHEFQSHTQP